MTKTGSSSGLFAELRRRRVLRTLALYILGAWGLMQVADVLLPALGLPEAAIGTLLFIAIGGFPVALVFGWFYDITPQGIRRTALHDADDDTAVHPLRTADYALLTGLLAVLGAVVYGIGGGVVELPLPQVAQEAPHAVPSDGPPMIGVLPFDFAGSGDDGEFFASGVHDDLLTRLAKIRGLRVVSRTSVLDYAGTSKKIPEIGRELGADAILEGGVRTAGGQIRINAQLIDAHTDEHLWAETYDRELTASNIFAIQSEIARAIATELRTTLTEGDSAELDLVPTSNMAAYRSYHEIMRWREGVYLSEENRKIFLEGLEKAYTLDPSFTRPMVEAIAILARPFFRLAPQDRDPHRLAEVEELIDRIGTVAPDSADHLTAQSLYFYYVLRDLDRADRLITRAQERAPSDTRLLEIQTYIQRRQGNYEGWVANTARAARLDPNNRRIQRSLARRLMFLHRYDEADAVLERLDDGDPDTLRYEHILALRTHGNLQRYRKDLEALLRAQSPEDSPGLAIYVMDAMLALHDYSAAADLAAEFPDLDAGRPYPRKTIPFAQGQSLLVAILSDNQARIERLLVEIAELTDFAELARGEGPGIARIMDESLLAIARGDREVAANDLVRGLRDLKADATLWFGERHSFCRALAMVDAAGEATACLRSAVEEPSQALRYLEPRLAYYDQIRDSAEFQGLYDELVALGQLVESGTPESGGRAEQASP